MLAIHYIRLRSHSLHSILSTDEKYKFIAAFYEVFFIIIFIMMIIVVTIIEMKLWCVRIILRKKKK